MSASLSSLAEGTRQRAEAWLAFLRSSGIPFQVTSTRRSTLEQRRLFDKFQRGESELPAAEPGTSDHEIGRALDLVFESEEDLDVAVELAADSGFQWAGPADPVHFVDILEAPTLEQIQEEEGFESFETSETARRLRRVGELGKQILSFTGLFGDPRGCCRH